MHKSEKRFPEQDAGVRRRMFRETEPVMQTAVSTCNDVGLITRSIADLVNEAVIQFRKGNPSKAMVFILMSSLAATATSQVIVNNSFPINSSHAMLPQPSTTSHEEVHPAQNSTGIFTAQFKSASSPTLFAKSNYDNHGNPISSATPPTKTNAKKASISSSKAKANPEVISLVNQLPIFYVNNEDRSGLKVTEKYYIEVYYKIAQQIRRLLPFALHNEVLLQVLKSPDFKIYIRSPTQMELAGTYLYTQNWILIQWNPYLPDVQLSNILSNELHHAAICNKTRAKVGKTAACVLISNPAKIEKVYQLGLDKVEKYFDMFRRYMERKPITVSVEFQEFLEAVQDYEPLVFPLVLSAKQHAKLTRLPGVKKLEGERFLIPKGIEVGGEIFSTDIYIENVRFDADRVHYSLNFAKDHTPLATAQAFFADMQQRQHGYRTGYHKESTAYEKGRYYQLAEKISDIEMLSPSLQMFFFEDICSELSRFHAVNNYCNRPLMKMGQ